MRKFQVLVILALALSVALAFGGPNGRSHRPADVGSVVLSMPKEELSEEEVFGILEMIEEEKLARDVYFKLYEIWKIPAFERIAESEQIHMNALKVLIEKYELENPVTDLKEGEFKTEKFQKLYTELVEKGSKSLENALSVGAEIEKLDIADLEEKLEKVDNEDVKFVYERLKNGSENHLENFNRLLENGVRVAGRSGRGRGGRYSRRGHEKGRRGR